MTVDDLLDQLDTWCTRIRSTADETEALVTAAIRYYDQGNRLLTACALFVALDRLEPADLQEWSAWVDLLDCRVEYNWLTHVEEFGAKANLNELDSEGIPNALDTHPQHDAPLPSETHLDRELQSVDGGPDLYVDSMGRVHER